MRGPRAIINVMPHFALLLCREGRSERERREKLERQLLLVVLSLTVLPTSQGEAAVSGRPNPALFQSLPKEGVRRQASTAGRLEEAAENKLRKNNGGSRLGPSANHKIRAGGEQRNEF